MTFSFWLEVLGALWVVLLALFVLRLSRDAARTRESMQRLTQSLEASRTSTISSTIGQGGKPSEHGASEGNNKRPGTM